MITSVHIKNFKSVYDLKLDLGSFNVLIGENGCGKSNILEGITFGAAASADKLDYEFLGSRGVRVANPEFMFSAFQKKKADSKIRICFNTDDGLFNHRQYVLSNEEMQPNTWINETGNLDRENSKEAKSILFGEKNPNLDDKIEKLTEEHEDVKVALEMFVSMTQNFKKNDEKGAANLEGFIGQMMDKIIDDTYKNETIINFITYSPEESSLRKFEDSNQIYPIGIKGAGLFQYIKQINGDKKHKKIVKAIKKNLMLLDWYDDFELPKNLMQNEYKLQIRDRYLEPSLQYFDQRSTNEGFLYLLFYSVLFISDETPDFFGIDNIDASFNPKLCMKLTQNLAALAKKYNKQTIVTTHNPATLDGLDLKNDDHRLFVVRRNEEGHTIANRIEYNAKRKKKLSEIWTGGFIGGLPENF